MRAHLARSAASLAGLALLATVVLAACVPSATKGTMPPPGPNGQVDPSAVPDFVGVAGPDGHVVGYVTKFAVLDHATGDRTWPVFGDDLSTVVGQLVPGKGFVPAGVDPASVPTRPVVVEPSAPSATPSTDLAMLFVRNNGPHTGWIGVLGGGAFGSTIGFWGDGYVGIGCFPMSPGDRLMLLDRDPTQSPAVGKALIFVRGASAASTPRWVDLTTAGEMSNGIGVPVWWPGVVPSC